MTKQCDLNLTKFKGSSIGFKPNTCISADPNGNHQRVYETTNLEKPKGLYKIIKCYATKLNTKNCDTICICKTKII